MGGSWCAHEHRTTFILYAIFSSMAIIYPSVTIVGDTSMCGVKLISTSFSTIAMEYSVDLRDTE